MYIENSKSIDMKYYVLDRRAIAEKDIDLKGTTYDAKNKVVQEIFYAGTSIQAAVNAPFTVILDDRRTTYNKNLLDKIAIDTNETGAVCLISPAAQLVFTQLGLPIELIDVVIKGKKLELTNYKFVNVIGRVNCTDRTKSELRYLDENIIRRYYKLVLDETRIPKGTDIFLLGEDITMMMIVSERVKNAISDASLTGFNFIKPEDYKTFR